ncbi:unnamed protein product [Prorocentrum cordatum]|uniref:Altered inheritance of mitochondria protein 24, mitochondrial n=1 Tax=Prorocentrum cordatum TaxID=2364126 RepID=A0ABN9SNR8_9DINO|nr:unnamed protein product [Polarella glacialis]
MGSLTQHVSNTTLLYTKTPKANHRRPVPVGIGHVGDWILSSRADMSDMDVDMVVAAVRNRQCLQVHCDGGYVGTVGSAAFVVHAVEPRTGNITRAGYRGRFMLFAESSFHAELTAIDTASYSICIRVDL